MYIKKGDTSKVTENFTANELFSKSPDAPNEHYLDDNLIHAAQFLRTYYNTPVRVNSSFRTINHNTSIGGAKSSKHLTGKAIDLSFPNNPEILEQYNQDIVNKSGVFLELKTMGINGFGLYDSFLHVDTRNSNAFWDNRKKKV